MEIRNKVTFSDKMKSYLRHPGSGLIALLVLLATLATFFILIFLIAYILIKGIPFIQPDLFSMH